MYGIAGVANVTKTLNGTSYVWVKVHYYKLGDTTEEGGGWVTAANTTVVSTTVHTSNSNLKQYESLKNARYIYDYLYDDGNGWSSNDIYAILGNMEQESFINPGKWEIANDTSGGYGLVHWTPATNYINWLDSGDEKSDIDNQLERILYEVKNKLQWISSYHSPAMTFSEFTTSTLYNAYFLRLKSVVSLWKVGCQYFLR